MTVLAPTTEVSSAKPAPCTSSGTPGCKNKPVAHSD